MSPLYVYAVVGAAPRGDLGRGVGAEPLRVVRSGDLLVVAGDLSASPPLEAAALRGQDEVVRRLTGGVDALLPARFGSLVADAAALEATLAPRATELKAALALVAGREQMTLRVYRAGRGRAAGRAEADREDAAPGPASAEGGPGTRYLAGRRRAREQEAALPELAPLRRALAALVHAERVDRHRTPPLLASVHHLVTRSQSRAYLAAVSEAAPGLRGVRVSGSGPWAPYAFAPATAP